MLDLSKMEKLADGARRAGRVPVKTHFSADERRIVKDFFFSLCPPRKEGSMRMRSFFALCDLLGEPLDSSNWDRLEKANKVKEGNQSGGLQFFVGQRTVRSDPGHWDDWQLKCLGLKKVKPGVFVVGLNEIFYRHTGGHHLRRD